MRRKPDINKIPSRIAKEHIGLPTGGVVIEEAELLEKGSYVLEADQLPPGLGPLTVRHPAFLRVCGKICRVDPNAPDMRFEIGLPEEWNGKLLQLGGGGMCGNVPAVEMYIHGMSDMEETQLEQGYAVCSCDSGHAVGEGMSPEVRWNADWALNDEALRNFAYEQIKKLHDTAMYLVEAVYGEKPVKSYFYGGSEGGREALQALQRYPEDYDGAVCFFPVLNLIPKSIKDTLDFQRVKKAEKDGWLSMEERDMVCRIVLEACETPEGQAQGFVTDFTAAVKKEEEIRCRLSQILSGPQMETLSGFEESLKFPYSMANGMDTMPGYALFQGAPSHFLYPDAPEGEITDMSLFGRADISCMIMRDKEFDVTGFDYIKWKDKVQAASELLDATNPDLRRFQEKNGKLMLIHGMCDEIVTPLGSIAYYEQLEAFFGEKIQEFVRFYLAPGFGHGGGKFVISAPFLKLLDNWCEQGKAPEDIPVTDSGKPKRGRKYTMHRWTGRESQNH